MQPMRVATEIGIIDEACLAIVTTLDNMLGYASWA